MFFKKKTATPQADKKELLYKGNIKTGCKEMPKEKIIRELGLMLVETGYVTTAYIDGMLEREKTYSTYMGLGLAIPHGVEAAKAQVIESGIAVMTFPDGTMWDDEKANLVVGIASVGDGHLEILSNISEKVMDEDLMATLINGDVDAVYSILSAKE